ncbi:MAG: GntR family transcriptional regulator [Eubacteriales bacterium]|nr:GntR family transcriptional regulator [Eubacteriales bacterium]
MEYKSNIPIYLQVIDDIIQKLLSGSICLGSKLPSTRELAVTYKINPNTAARVYAEMERMGICHTRRGLGTFVNEDGRLIDDLRHASSQKLLSEFTDGMTRIGYTNETILTQLTEFLNKKAE